MSASAPAAPVRPLRQQPCGQGAGYEVVEEALARDLGMGLPARHTDGHEAMPQAAAGGGVSGPLAGALEDGCDLRNRVYWESPTSSGPVASKRAWPIVTPGGQAKARRYLPPRAPEAIRET